MSKIPFRLEVIASLVTARIICDVGCDHGKLVNYLFENNKINKAIVSDISYPSLEKAINLLNKNKYNFEYICCDGLVGYKDKFVDECIITGMGGDEIIKIIKNSPVQIPSFILSPQHNNIEVKKFLMSIGYNINYDIIINDKDKYYNIFRAVKSDKVSMLTDFQLVIGDANFKDLRSSASEFVEHEINKIEKILNNNNFDNIELKNYLGILKEYNKRKRKYEKNFGISKA